MDAHGTAAALRTFNGLAPAALTKYFVLIWAWMCRRFQRLRLGNRAHGNSADKGRPALPPAAGPDPQGGVVRRAHDGSSSSSLDGGPPAARPADSAQEAPQAGQEASPLDFYDAVLSISKLEDVYVPERGWQVQVTQRRNFDFGAPRVGVRVIPIGQFNSGKTWLIAQLSGAQLPSGVSVHTEGISMKEATADNHSIILLDTVGSNSPMDALPNGVQPFNSSEGVETVLQELRAQEDFYRQVCFELGQVILFVVGQMSHKDQTDLVRLSRAVRKDRVRKDILVVHNLREWDMAMLLRTSAKDGLNYPDRTRSLFQLSDESLEVTVGTETGTVIRHGNFFQGEGGGQQMAVNVYHYYLTNDRLPCSCNRFAIQDMKATITRGARGGGRSLAEEFAAAATKVQGRFASFNGGEPEIVFDPDASRFRTGQPVPGGAYRMKPRDLGSYFTTGSDDPAYNIMLVPGTVRSFQGRGSTEAQMQERRAYQVQLELPGLCEESLADIRERFQRKDESGALRKEQLEGERGAEWTISFQAKLMNVPADLYDKVAEGTVGDIGLSRDFLTHQVAESGSRNHFSDGVRTVKVVLRTGIMDYDRNQEAVITYLHGVLGITLVQG